MPDFVTLPCTFSGDTWDGFTWAISDADGDTDFAGTITLARFQIQDLSGNEMLTLSSDVSGEVTINTASDYNWSVTIEPRVLSLDAGTYTIGLEISDDSTAPDRVKTRLTGTLHINSDPVL